MAHPRFAQCEHGAVQGSDGTGRHDHLVLVAPILFLDFSFVAIASRRSGIPALGV
jgi:hypothetical protein